MNTSPTDKDTTPSGSDKTSTNPGPLFPGQSNLFKPFNNPFDKSGTTAPSGNLFASAMSSTSTTPGGLFGGAKASGQSEPSKQESKPLASTGMFPPISGGGTGALFGARADKGKSSNNGDGTGFFDNKGPEQAAKQENSTSGSSGTPVNLFAMNKPTAQPDAAKKEEKAEVPAPKFIASAAGPSGGSFKESAQGQPLNSSGPFGSGGGLFGGAKVQAQTEAGKQEEKTNAPAPSGMFGSTSTTGGLFGGAKVSGQQEAPKQENSSSQPSGGLFGLKPATQTDNKAPAATGMFASATNKNQGEPEKKQEAKPLAPTGMFASSPGGLFGGVKAQAETETGKEKKKLKTSEATEATEATGMFGSFNTTAGTGIFAGAKAFTQQEAKPLASAGIFGGAKAQAQTETAKEEKPKTPVASGIFASTSNNTTGGLFGGAKASTQQEPKPLASVGMFGSTSSTGGGLFGGAKAQAQTEAAKEEEKPKTPVATGMFGSTANTATTTGGLFGGAKASGQQEAQKQETKPLTPVGIFGSTSGTTTPTGGLFAGAKVQAQPQTETTKQEEKSNTPAPTGMFGGSTLNTTAGTGIFGKQAAPQTNMFASTTSTTGSGMFGGTPASQTGGQSTSSWPAFGGTSNTFAAPNKNTVTSQSSEAPGQKMMKEQASNLSPEKNKQAPAVNISNLPSGGVQSSLFNQSQANKPTLFSQAPAATQAQNKPQNVIPQADDAKLEAVLKAALAKEEKISQKIKEITGKMKNIQSVDQFLKEQDQAIDAFYDEFTQILVKKVTDLANQQKQELKNKLVEEAKDFKTTNEELSKHLEKLVTENSLAQVKDQLLDSAKKSPSSENIEQAVKSSLATSFELENGFSPLVKKYKAIKYTIPSLNNLAKPLNRQPANKDTLLQKAEPVITEFEKLMKDVNLVLIDAIGSLAHPLKAHLPNISKSAGLENSVLRAEFPYELPGVPFEEKTFPKDLKIREVVYKLHKNEGQKLRELNVLSKEGEEELALRVQPVSVCSDLLAGDLILFNQVPYEIKSKTSSSQKNEIEFELENVLTGVLQSEKLHSKWDQAHELVLTENFVVVKPKNNKQYYTLVNLKDAKSTKGLVKAVKVDRFLHEKLQTELEDILKEDKRAVVRVLKIKGEDVIVACQKLRK